MMYNSQKGMIFIKRKDITFIFSFVLFLLLGAGVFLFVENKMFEASIPLVIAVVLFVLILVFNLKKNNEDSDQDELEILSTDYDEAQPVIEETNLIENEYDDEDDYNEITVKEPETMSSKEVIDVPEEINQDIIVIETFKNDAQNYIVEADIIEEIDDAPLVDYITLKMTQVHFENLNSLIDQLEQANMVKDNEDFMNGMESDDKIFAKLFPSLPIVNVIKDKRLGYKIVGGIDSGRIYELGQIHEDDLPYVKEIYPQTKNLNATIEGGKLKDFQTEPPSQKFLPYRIKIKFYI